MYRFALVAVLVVVLAVSLTSCTRSGEPEADAPPVEEAAALPEPPEDAAEAEEAAEASEAEPADTMDADAVVEEVGAPLFEDATSESVEMEDGATVATFTTPESYQDVKDFYLAELEEPDWTNNGFEMGAMGGDTWEFKSADETKLVVVERDSGDSATTIEFTLKPAE